MKRLDENALCPCGSGKKYKACCYKKDFVYVTDKDGNVYKEMKISNPKFLVMFKKFLQEQNKEFKEIFGRNMKDDDPVFFQDAYASSESEITERIVSIMREAKIKPHLIYAFIKTGRLLSEENKNKITDEELKEWDEKIDEYFKLVKEGKDPFKDFPDDVENIIKEFKNCIFLISHILYEDKFNLNKDRETLSYIVFSLSRVRKNLKSIVNLQGKKDTANDALALTRAIYEAYLCLNYAINHRELDNIQNRIRKMNKADLAKNSIYEEDEKIHTHIYPILSGYTHPSDMKASIEYSIEEMSNVNKVRSASISLLYFVLIMAEIKKLNELEESIKSDIELFLNRNKKSLLSFFKDNTVIISRIQRINL